MVPSRSGVENGTDDRGCSSHLGPSATRIKNGLVGLKMHVQRSAGVNMHSSQWGDSPRFTPVSLLRIDSGTALRPAETRTP